MSLEFSVLGPLTVRRNGVDLDVGPPRQRMLLTCLLTSPNRAVSVDRLAELLWPDAPPAQAVVSIQAWVSRLRGILEVGRPARAPSEVLVTRSPGYLVVASANQLDSLRFEELLGAARAAMSARPSDAMAAVGEALALWRGDAYSDLRGAGSLVAEAVRLEELRLAAHELRTQAQLALGRAHEAIPDAIAHAEQHPLRDLAVRLAVTALASSGRQPEALRLLERARRARRDIGLTVSPELSRLEQAVLDHQHDGADAAASQASTVRIAPDAATNDVAEEQSLVGRDADVERVSELLLRAGATLLLRGEAGIGKTRLAAEAAARWARARGGRVAWGRCQEVSVPAPLWPILELLRDLDQPPLVDVAHTVAVDVGRTLLLDKAVRALRDLPDRLGPIALVVDDVQWADAESMVALGTLAADCPDGMALIMTQRTATGEPDLPSLAAMRRLPLTAVVEVEPLDHDGLHALARNVLGAEPDEALVRGIEQRTRGNPFLAVELLRLQRDGRSIRDAALVPPAVQEVLGRRLARLPAECRRVLHAAAIQGVQFDFELVAELTGAGEERTLDLLEVTAAAGLTEDDGSGWRFAHGLVADAVAAELSPTRRARLHAQVAEHLERAAVPDWSRIAHHWLHAPRAIGADPALAALARAEAHAVGALAIDTALTLNATRLDLFASLPDRSTRAAAEVRAATDRVNLTLVRLGFDVTVMREALERAQAIAALHGDPHAAGHLLHGEAWASIFNGDIDRGVILGEELLKLATRSGDRDAELVAHHDLAVISFQRGELRAADEHLAAFRSASPSERERAIGGVFAADDDREAFLDAIDASIRVLRSGEVAPLDELWMNARTPIGRLYAALFATSLLTLLGDYEAARPHVGHLRAARGSGELQLYAMYERWFSAVIDVATAAPDASIVRARRDELLGSAIESLGVLTFTGPARAILGDLFLRAGSPAEAVAAADEALASPGTRYGDVFAWRTKAKALEQLGEHAAAAAARAAGHELAVRQGLVD